MYHFENHTDIVLACYYLRKFVGASDAGYRVCLFSMYVNSVYWMLLSIGYGQKK